jgi:isoleucyl-tRNA synthetase
MELARTVVQLVLLLRNRSHINVRQPLSRMLLVIGHAVDQAEVERVRDIILDEVNVRAIEYIADSSGVVKCSAKADFKKLGPRLGKQMKAVAAQIAALGDAEIPPRFQAAGKIDVTVDGTLIEVRADEVDILSEEIGAWTVAQDGGITVALDVHIDDELRARAMPSEVVNPHPGHAQDRRPGISPTASTLSTRRRRPLAASIAANREFICRETLAVELTEVAEPKGEWTERFEIGDEWIVVAIKRSAV